MKLLIAGLMIASFVAAAPGLSTSASACDGAKKCHGKKCKLKKKGATAAKAQPAAEKPAAPQSN